MSSVDIKEAIKAKLDTLAGEEGPLRYVAISDLKKNPLDADIPAFPAGFVMPPSIERESLDNRNTIRIYTFDLMFLWNADNLSDATTVEENIEAILDAFDNDPTLGGTAMAGMFPVASAPQPVQTSSKNLIMAVVQIQAKQHVQLTYG